MLEHEFNQFKEDNKNITIEFDGEYAYCRNERLPWYQKDKENATRMTKEKFSKMTPNLLLEEINKGLNIEQITRITGYMTRVSQWNKGKLGELKDRQRQGDFFTSLSTGFQSSP